MRTSTLLYSTSLLLMLTACKKHVLELDKTIPLATDHHAYVLSKMDINRYIGDAVQSRRGFKWSESNEQLVWSALAQSDDKVLSIGYKPASWSSAEVAARMGTFDINSKEWREAKEEVLRLVFGQELLHNAGLKIENLEVWPERYLPVLCVTVQNEATINKLRQSQYVRYVEPIGYSYTDKMRESGGARPGQFKSLGCDGAPASSEKLVQDIDYTLQLPLAKASWHYGFHNISQAWSVSTGKGVKIMVVDTGCSLEQENLNQQFNQGYSAGRTIEHLVTLPRPTFFGTAYGKRETVNDACGHGTCMAGIVAAPRGIDGSACGVAYNCDLVSVRAAENVILNQSREVKGVADAFNMAAQRDDIKIIIMSMGYPFYISQVADAIRAAANRGKLIFCAAGTSSQLTSWLPVVFPASMPEVNAVTGVQDNLRYRCSNCHEGPEVDFGVVMQKGAGNKLDAVALAAHGDAPGTVGGSSAATATMAGIAALVWSRYPFKSAAEILAILKASSTNPGNSNWGAGIVDAAKAVGVDPVVNKPPQ